MNKRHILAGVLVVLLVVAAAVYLKKRNEAPAVVPQADEGAVQVPAFAFPDASGALVQLDAIEADVRIITFWASWSPYSVKELPALAQLKKQYGSRVAVVALNRDTDSAEGRRFLESLEFDEELIFAYDRGDTYFKQVGGFNMPETVFVDREGKVLAHVHGPMTYEEMVRQVDVLLGTI